MAVDPSVARFRHVVGTALAHLEARREEINDLNVFPVADGDTGDNMASTLRAVVAALDVEVARARPLDDGVRDELTRDLARAALYGGRGNSGVILSQLIAGAADELAGRPGELIGPALVSAGLAAASRRAYASVAEPAEGTILTVMGEVAATAAQVVARLGDAALRPADDAEQAAVVADQLTQAIAAGADALERGRERHPVLRAAGVVDAGGHGALVVLAGVVAALRGGAAPEVAHRAAARVSRPEHASTTFRWCTSFAVTGEGLDPDAVRAGMDELGDSVVVVGDRHTLKVHVHTDEPDAAMALAAAAAGAEVSHVDLSDMQAQVAARAARGAGTAGDGPGGAPAPGRVGLPTDGRWPGQAAAGDGARPADGDGDGDVHRHPDPPGADRSPHAPLRSGLLVVTHGAGLVATLRELGADVLDPGPGARPSVRELLGALHRVTAEEVVLLTGSADAVPAAEQAAALSEREVVVVPTADVAAAVAVAVEHHPELGAADAAAIIGDVLAGVRTGGVAPAARADPGGRWAVGDALGYVDGGLVAAGDPAEALAAVLGALEPEAELLTLHAADDAPLEEDRVAALAADPTRLEQRPGGQDAWWWLLSAE